MFSPVGYIGSFRYSGTSLCLVRLPWSELSLHKLESAPFTRIAQVFLQVAQKEDGSLEE